MFVVGQGYTREQVAEIINLPSDKRKGGAWATGYSQCEESFYIFTNVGAPGRTGHDYPNSWNGKRLNWYGKTNARKGQPQIDRMISGNRTVHLFWRAEDRNPFTYAGRAVAVEVSDDTPVRITWEFDEPAGGPLDVPSKSISPSTSRKARTSLPEIVAKVNLLAVGRPIGKLQHLRQTLRGLQRLPSKNIFRLPKDKDWSFHIGGRDELQFNLAFEKPSVLGDFRYGVAFSLEPSQSLPSIEPLLPKIALFNDYLREHYESLSGLWMWYYEKDERSTIVRPTLIEPSQCKPGRFIFLGNLCPRETLDYGVILDTLDLLLPLWRFIEEQCSEVPQSYGLEVPISPGLPKLAPQTEKLVVGGVVSVALRHNQLQAALFEELVAEYGRDYVGAEHPAPGGGQIDIMVISSSQRIVYEIKTAKTARGCVREAIGQLLDYGFWPNTLPPDELCVVGEPPLDEFTELYLEVLNKAFPAHISYRQVTPAAD